MMGMSIRGELSEIMTENRHRPKTRITLLENLAETMRISSREVNVISVISSLYSMHLFIYLFIFSDSLKRPN